MPAKETLREFKARIASMRIDELLERFPQSKPTLYNHFGASCFDCPAAAEENVACAIRVHDSLEEEFYADLAEALEIELDKVPSLMNEDFESKPWKNLERSQPCVVALGLFDGVHLGHRAILNRTLEAAERLKMDSVVFSFRNHPRTVIAGNGSPAPRLLVTVERRYRLMQEAGVGAILSPEFTKEWAQTPAEVFARVFLAETLKAHLVIVGFNYCFGRKAEGRTQHLLEFGDRFGFEVEIVPPFQVGGEEVSSTRVRNAILAGNLDEARRLLGRPHELTGTVVAGEGRGKSLGFPTANIAPDLPPLLPQGVYAVQVHRGAVDNESPLGNGMFFLGPRKTFGESEDRATVEVHVFDFEGDLYGERLRLELVAKVRDGMKFESADELSRQLDRDRSSCKELL